MVSNDENPDFDSVYRWKGGLTVINMRIAADPWDIARLDDDWDGPIGIIVRGKEDLFQLRSFMDKNA